MADHGYLEEAIQIFTHTTKTDAGSWKDVKYLVDFLTDKDTRLVSETHPLAQAALQLLASQIEADYTSYRNNENAKISLAARWAPRREKGRFAPVTRFFVQTIHASHAYTNKSMKDVRKMLALLNQDLKTPQIDMCRGTWSQLNFNSMTSYTLLKHKKAFLNLTKQGEQRSTKEDRVTCASQYTRWLNSDTKQMNVKTIYPYEFVRDVIEKSPQGEEIRYYNDAWKTQVEHQYTRMSEEDRDYVGGIMIPMIDVSGSMSCDKGLPMYNAIALGIRLAELNAGCFHNKALTFESRPSWAHYSDSQSFVEKVYMTQRLGWGGSTDFEAALDSILTRVIQTRMSPLAVQHLSLVVFSDM